MAAKKGTRMARAMVTAMRVPVNKVGGGITGHGIMLSFESDWC